jgi:hypothetical protein
MAKSKTFTFDDLNAELANMNPLGSVMEQSTFSDVTEWIDTGNYHLNACVSGSLFGGWPNNRACSIAGPSGTGKTYLILNSVREAIDMGYNVVFYDSEAAVDKDLMKKFGIDTSKVNYQPINTVQDFRTSVTTITGRMQEVKRAGGEVPKIMIILDSAGNLATAKEIDDARTGSDKSDMTRSKILKSIFRIIMTPMADLKFHLHYTQGMNKYVGLENYIDWEDIGITKGIIEKGQKIPKATARNWICKHLDETVPNSEFFSEKVFTQEILEKINNKIHDMFNYNTEVEMDFDSIIEDDGSDD